mgnify:CR=1 FL=1|tara:strand:+ start:306 stop:1013 length:708 start_codon:yes stop_codon:yes gene_type:complete
MNSIDQNQDTTDLQVYRDELDSISESLTAETYRPGPWQKLIKQLEGLSKADRAQLTGDVSRVSNQLHGRNGFPQLPVAFGFAFELILLLVSVYLLGQDSVWVRLAGVVTLGLALQPSLKILTATLFGVRYAYVFLWYFEPRFKMQFGTYLLRSRGEKITINMMGSIGTPLALVVGFFALQEVSWLSLACLVGALGAAGMQIAAFFAALLGVRKVGPFLLANLTTPATLGNLIRNR